MAVVGAGNVGATAAFLLALGGFDVTLIDVLEGLAAGKALDMAQALAISGRGGIISGSTDFSSLQGAGVVVVTAGLARKPGMSRSDLLTKNAQIIRSVAAEVRMHSPAAKVIVVTNPMDVMTFLFLKKSGFEAGRVVGMGGVLDSGRMRHFLAEEAKVETSTVECMVIGPHGDGMLPLVNQATVSGRSAGEILSSAQQEEVTRRTRHGGAEIVSFLKTGSAYFAPAVAIETMVGAIVRDEKIVLPASVLLEGQYGLRDLCLGVPVRLGGEGVEEILEPSLSADELEALLDGARAVREDIAMLS